ncbi:MAG: haloacid dehalogenase-like hydrolase [Patescibacteria group bacterium]|nr:haloacid dehalogenase-like hydrolase [Patescibacteria group bacterium]
MEKIIISNPEKLQEKIENFKANGADTIHILADFDKTLTKAIVEGQISSSVIAQIRNGKYLTPDYAPKAEELAAHYHPIEKNPDIPRKEKDGLMHEWWSKHFDLLIKSGLNKKVMEEIVSKRTLKMREGSLEFLDLLYEKNIPIIIMSAAPGDMIRMYLEQDGRLYKNVHIIANFFDFDSNGLVTKVREPMIHSLNKYETMIKDFPVYKEIENRKNVLLLGDGLDDLGMVEGFDYDNLISIGFLNKNVKENLENYKKSFDVVITNDGNMEYVNELMKKILG